jgi:hypothetical protein
MSFKGKIHFLYARVLGVGAKFRFRALSAAAE